MYHVRSISNNLVSVLYLVIEHVEDITFGDESKTMIEWLIIVLVPAHGVGRLCGETGELFCSTRHQVRYKEKSSTL